MKIGERNIAPILADSGTFGFFGEGYWWHCMVWLFIWPLKRFATLGSKTVTAFPNVGNMPLNDDGTPKDRFPKCIFIDVRRWISGAILNAVKLSNYGAWACLRDGRWQELERQWILSFMPVEISIEGKMRECRRFVDIVRVYSDTFRVRPIIALNVSCPNAEPVNLSMVGRMLDVLGDLGLEIVVKVSVEMSCADTVTISQHPKCSAIHVSNTLHWSKLPESVLRKVFPDCWNEERGEWVSPLEEFGGGGYSGKELLPMVLDWIRDARKAGLKKPIIGGGGILTPLDVWRVRRAGASVVAVASVAMLRPWRVPGIVLAAWAYDLFN